MGTCCARKAGNEHAARGACLALGFEQLRQCQQCGRLHRLRPERQRQIGAVREQRTRQLQLAASRRQACQLHLQPAGERHQSRALCDLERRVGMEERAALAKN